MKAFWGAAILGVSLTLPGAAAPGGGLRGFTSRGAVAELATESRFLDLPTAQDALDITTAVAARPHYAGTPADYALAVSMRDRLRAYGIRAELQAFRTRVDTPRELVLELAPPADIADAPRSRKRRAAFPVPLDLSEAPERSDPPTAARAIGLPFNAGSGDGDVSAPLVYAAHGSEADYATLAHADVDVRGAVVLVRYGTEFRGRLAERAQAHGAAGVIFYSDPQDTGDARGLVDPAGPWQPSTAIERGWVGPNVHIPTLPVSAANARILLAALRGASGPDGWTGTLPVEYPVGRGPGRVHLIVKLNHKLTTLWNTIGTIAGVHADQSVIVGAHRDAWVYGAGDNGGGVTTVLELARGLGALVRGGWRPQRSIVLAGWDGGEIGLAGSQAYLYANRVSLPRGCFAYLNADRTVTGPDFAADGVGALAPLIIEAARRVRDPLDPAAMVAERWAAQRASGVPAVDIPTGGSDAETFLRNAGIAVAGMRFSGPFGVDHSSYDTLRYATTISDPLFGLHRAAAQLYGVVTLRLADAAAVPYALDRYGSPVRGALARLTARANADGLALNSGSVRAALDRLAAGAAGFDRTGPRDDLGAAAAQLAAVRILDSAIYGTNGNDGIMLPALDAAVAAHDQDGLNAGIDALAADIGRAADALSAAAGL